MTDKIIAQGTNKLCRCCRRRLLWVRKGLFGWFHCAHCDQP